MGNYWATPENDSPYTPDLHIGGTITKNRNGKTLTEFWLSRPRPKGVSYDDWEAQEQARWDRIFPKKAEVL